MFLHTVTRQRYNVLKGSRKKKKKKRNIHYIKIIKKVLQSAQLVFQEMENNERDVSYGRLKKKGGLHRPRSQYTGRFRCV